MEGEQTLEVTAKKEVQNVSEDEVQGVNKENVQDVSKEEVQDVSKEVVQDVSNDDVQDVSKEDVQDVNKEDVQDDSKEEVQNVSEENEKNGQDVNKEEVQDVINETDGEVQDIKTAKQSDEIGDDSISEHSELREEDQDYKRVLVKTAGKLKDLMIPDLIIDVDEENKLFDFTAKMDIKEQKTTREKNHLIWIKARKKEKHYKELKELLKRSHQEGIVEFLTRTENGQNTETIEKELYKIAEKRLNLRPNYFKLKKELKDDLIKFYRRRHSRIPLSPLFDEKDTPMDTFYIRPEINEETTGVFGGMRQVKSLSDMFKSGHKACREVYLTADAGIGKTSFSKYLAISWCQANCPPETGDSTCFEKNDIDFIHEFEFVFLVLLRDSYGLCSIDDLIFELIVSRLGHSENFDKGFLQQVLNREKCLVILDGLDEWTHPEYPQKPCYVRERSIPHRNEHELCTILTTTRPWKLGDLTLYSSNELNKNIVLTKLSKESADTLTKRVIQRLKSLSDDEQLKTKTNEFDREIRATGNGDLVFVPLLLMYITCLWCGGDEIGNSKTELYLNIVELLLSRTIKTHGELQSSHGPFTPDIPKMFTGHTYCTRYFKLLMALGELAYHALFDKTIENSLVFDGSLAKEYLKQEDLKVCLLSGILSESSTKTYVKHMSKVSFSHKTVQEFFSAIYLSCQNDGEKKVVENCKTVKSILDVSTVCQFISGMNATMMCGISEGFVSVINNEKETSNYRTRTIGRDIFFKESQLYYMYEMSVSCLKEMPESENVQLFLQDVFITSSQDDQALKRLSKLNKSYIKSLYLEPGTISRSLREIIELTSLTDLNNKQKLCYQGDMDVKQADDINCILSSSVESLSLYCQEPIHENKLNEGLDQLHNLRYLYIKNFVFSHERLETLLNVISSKGTLKSVKLSDVQCDDHHHDCDRMKLDLSGTQLTTLRLDSLPPLQLNIPTQSLVDIELCKINLDKLPSQLRNIERIALSDMEVSVEILQNYAQFLDTLPHLVTLGIDDCLVEPNIERLRFMDEILYSEKYDATYNLYDDNDGTWSFEFNTRKPCKDL